MADTDNAKTATPRRKFPKFTELADADKAKLVESGKLKRFDIAAKPERTTASGKKRAAQPARTVFIPTDRASALALYGGNEKALLQAAGEYLSTAVKRANSKGKVADPNRAINRSAEQFIRFKNDPSIWDNLPQESKDAMERVIAQAKANPVAPRKRTKKDKASK